MDDLTKCLYKLVWEKRMGSLAEDTEYLEAAMNAEHQEERIASSLDDTQRRELRALLDSIAARGDIANEHLFQAALSLARELSGLVRG